MESISPKTSSFMTEQSLDAHRSRPLLTIAIPTYNRAACLTELLSVLADQLQNETRVELIISDNASPDGTPKVVSDFIARGLQVRYIRNTHNVGSDANFLLCFEQARGKYFWLFSDDDLILPGGVARIVSYCARSDYDLIWLKAYPFEESHTPLSPGASCDPIEISDPKEYAKRIHAFFTFISSNIINRDTVLAAGPKPFSELIGTGLVQLGWTYTALSRYSLGLIVYEKLIGSRLNNSGGFKLSQVFGPNLTAITKTWLQPEILGQMVINGTLQRYWPAMLFAYRSGLSGYFREDTKLETLLTPVFGNNLRYWMFVYPIAVLPYYLSAAWLFLTRVINRVDRAAGYPTLGWGVAGTRPTQA